MPEKIIWKPKAKRNRGSAIIADRRANKDDVVFEQPGIDVVGPFAPPGILPTRTSLL
jgi:hypothetical protein